MEAKVLAKTFHEVYEKLAPVYKYETNKETKIFDENSPNGKLMIATCEGILNMLNQESTHETPAMPKIADLDEALTIALSLWKIAHSPIGITREAMVEYKKRIDKLAEIIYPL
jgi:hypothetical protein